MGGITIRFRMERLPIFPGDRRIGKGFTFLSSIKNNTGPHPPDCQLRRTAICSHSIAIKSRSRVASEGTFASIINVDVRFDLMNLRTSSGNQESCFPGRACLSFSSFSLRRLGSKTGGINSPVCFVIAFSPQYKGFFGGLG